MKIPDVLRPLFYSQLLKKGKLTPETLGALLSHPSGKTLESLLLEGNFFSEKELSNFLEEIKLLYRQKLQKSLLKTLIQKKWTTPEELQLLTKKYPNKKLENVLLEQGILKKEQLAHLLKILKNKLFNEMSALQNLEKKQPQNFLKPKSNGANISFGKYQVVEKIAQGGMGIVYKVKHSQLEQIYALKILLTGESASSEEALRLHREAKNAAKLNHPNIVQVFDFGEEKGQPYFVMEYVQGQTLADLLKEGLSVKKSLKIMVKVLKALHYAHENGVIHRDLKPTNIFVSDTGEPKIGDFGLSKDLSRKQDTRSLTASGEMMGTPDYMPPEQVVGNKELIGVGSDVYSIGACLYSLLTKQCPFEGETLHELFIKVISQDPKRPSSLNSNLSRNLDTIILKALDKNVEQRYSSAKAFAEDIERYLTGDSIKAKPPSRFFLLLKWSRRHYKILSLFALLFLSLGAFFGFEKWQVAQKESRISIEELSRLEEWLRLLKGPHSLAQDYKENAVQEISTMKSEKVLQILMQHLAEGTAYYLQKEPEIHFFYESIVLILGKMENSKAKKNLFQALKSIANKKRTSDAVKSFLPETYYMVLIVKALDALKVKGITEELNQLRFQLGEESLFWLETQDAFENIVLRYDINYSLAKNPKELTQRGFLKMLHHDMDEALEDFNQALKKDPKYYKAFCYQALWYHKKNNPKNAFETAKEAILSASHKAFPYYVCGQIQFERNERDSALINFKKALKLNPNALRFYLEVGILKHRVFQHKDAIAVFEHIIEIHPRCKSAYFYLGNIAATTGDFAAGLKYLTKAIELDPNFVEALYERGQTFLNRGNYATAIRDFTQAIYQNPKLAKAYYKRGVAKMKVNDFEGAISDLLFANSIRSKFDYWLVLADAYEKKEDFLAAEKAFEKAFQLEMKNPNLFHKRGNLYLKQKKYKLAIADFEKLLHLNQDYIKGYFFLGEAYFYLRKTSVAKLKYQEFLRLTKEQKVPQLPEMLNKIKEKFPEATFWKESKENSTSIYEKAHQYYLQAKYFKKSSDFQQALESINKAIELNPYQCKYFNAKGRFLLENNELRAALKNFNRAIELNPSYSIAYDSCGLALISLNRTKEALQRFDQAIKIDPNFFNPYYNRGSLKKRLDDLNGALSDYDIALSLNPTFYRGYAERGFIKMDIKDTIGAKADFQLFLKLSKNIETEEKKERVKEILSHFPELKEKE